MSDFKFGVCLGYNDREKLLQAKKDRVFITHSGCEAEVLEGVEEYLKSLNYFDEILITRAGGVISSHCGPGTLGVLYLEGQVTILETVEQKCFGC